MTVETEYLGQAVKRLVGLPCSRVVAGQGVGTAVNLDFGKAVRSKKVKTSRGSHEFSMYEASIFVQDATWRLEDTFSVICSSAADDNSEGSALSQGLNRLLNQRIIEASLGNLANDLTLKFENGLVLLVFSVPIIARKDAGNYSVHVPEQVLSVEFDGSVTASPMSW